MANKRDLYKEDEILTLEFDDGAVYDVGIMRIFDVRGAEYIALDNLSEDIDEVYLYRYIETKDGFELMDIPEKDYERVAQIFDIIME